MEDQIYETGLLGVEDKNKFKKYVDSEIGTEYEVNDEGDGTYYIMVYDLTMKEVEKLRDFENDLKPSVFCISFKSTDREDGLNKYTQVVAPERDIVYAVAMSQYDQKWDQIYPLEVYENMVDIPKMDLIENYALSSKDYAYLLKKKDIVAKLKSENAQTLSDAEIERIMGETVLPKAMIEATKRLRDLGLLKPKEVASKQDADDSFQLNLSSAELAELVDAKFSEMYTVQDILKGNSLEMHQEARKIVLQELREEASKVEQNIIEAYKNATNEEKEVIIKSDMSVQTLSVIANLEQDEILKDKIIDRHTEMYQSLQIPLKNTNVRKNR